MSEPSYKILIIDDEEVTRITLASLLENPAHEIITAEDGIQGIKIARQSNPDVVLLDVMMPGMDGFEVCRRIRSDPEIAEVPIIMITALDDRASKINGLEAGADNFLTKPFDGLELNIRLQTLKRVGRYRQLLTERQNLNNALIELAKKHEQLQSFSRRILEAQENERQHVAMELYDGFGQLVTGLKLILERQDQDPKTVISEARAVTKDLIQEIRKTSLNLRPSDLDDLGLSAALDGLFKRFKKLTKMDVRHNINPSANIRYNWDIETVIFRVIQEALINAARHAETNEVHVTLNLQPHHIQARIVDTGKGFKVEEKDLSKTMGISGMAERIRMAGGIFTLRSTPGMGTLIMADFELKDGG